MPSLGKTLITESLAASGDQIKDLLAKGDAGLMTILGLDARLETFKASLKDADALTGKAREIFNRKLTERLSPNLYNSDLSYMIRDAQRQADPKKKDGDSAACC